MIKNTIIIENQEGYGLVSLIKKHGLMTKSRTVKSWYYLTDTDTLNFYRNTEIYYYEKEWYVITYTWNNSKENCCKGREFEESILINKYKTKKECQVRERKMISLFKKVHITFEIIGQWGQ